MNQRAALVDLLRRSEPLEINDIAVKLGTTPEKAKSLIYCVRMRGVTVEARTTYTVRGYPVTELRKDVKQELKDVITATDEDEYTTAELCTLLKSDPVVVRPHLNELAKEGFIKYRQGYRNTRHWSKK